MALTDFHSHILPGIDDGSPSAEVSVAMLQAAAEQGVRHVVATPHFYAQHHKPEKFLAKRAESEQLLRQELVKHPELPRVSVGAEVLYFSGIADSPILSQLTIAGTNYILIELPMPPWSDRVYKDLENIWRKQDLIPVIAHIDRYLSLWNTGSILRRLSELPVLVQANAEFFLRRSTRRLAFRMLEQGRIHLLGSDCHNMTDRKPNMGEAIALLQKKFGTGILDHIRYFEREIFPNDYE